MSTPYLSEIIKLEGYSYRLWHYQASLSQLIIRARSSDKIKQDIYIVFQGVNYLQMPIYWEKGDLRLASETELEAMAEKMGVHRLEPGSLLRADTPQGVIYILGSVVGLCQNVDSVIGNIPAVS